MNKINENGLESIFKFTGWTATRDILGIADALILPSTNEGFPLSVIEAFLMKVPVFRTHTGGFDDQKYCKEIKLNDPTQVANTICWAVENSNNSLPKQLDDAFEYAISNFTIKQMTKKTLDVYKEVLSNQRN